jgi:hypothetical protein
VTHWKLSIENGDIIAEKEGDMPHPPDPFIQMQQAARQAEVTARVSNTLQRSSAYGEIKVSFTISVDCPQDQEWIRYATENTFKAAVRYVNNAFSSLVPEAEHLKTPELWP